METLRGALLGVVPRIREAAAEAGDAVAFMEAAERPGAVRSVYRRDVPEKVTDIAQHSDRASDIDESVREAFLPDDRKSFLSATRPLKDESGSHNWYIRMLRRCVGAVGRGLYGVARAGPCAVFDGLLSDPCETFGEGFGERLGSIVGRLAEKTDGHGFYWDQT